MKSLARRFLSGVLVAFCFVAFAKADDVGDPAFLAISGGAFDVADDHTAAEGRVEYRSNLKLWIFKPFAGVMATSDSALFGYAGVLVDVPLGDSLVATLSFAPGAFHDGNGKDLGNGLEFRSQIELAYRFKNRSRLGLSVAHMSNAGLGDENPGTESVMLTYAMPFDGLLGD